MKKNLQLLTLIAALITTNGYGYTPSPVTNAIDRTFRNNTDIPVTIKVFAASNNNTNCVMDQGALMGGRISEMVIAPKMNQKITAVIDNCGGSRNPEFTFAITGAEGNILSAAKKIALQSDKIATINLTHAGESYTSHTNTFSITEKENITSYPNKVAIKRNVRNTSYYAIVSTFANPTLNGNEVCLITDENGKEVNNINFGQKGLVNLNVTVQCKSPITKKLVLIVKAEPAFTKGGTLISPLMTLIDPKSTKQITIGSSNNNQLTIEAD